MLHEALHDDFCSVSSLFSFFFHQFARSSTLLTMGCALRKLDCSYIRISLAILSEETKHYDTEIKSIPCTQCVPESTRACVPLW